MSEAPLPPSATSPEAYVDSARRGLLLTGELLHLLNRLQASRIEVLPLKGPVLAETLYDDPTLRPYLDLDLLVRKRDVPAAIRVLSDEGYSLSSALGWLPEHTQVRLNSELTFRHRGGAQVDLHWEIAPKDYPFRFDSEVLWSSRRSVQIGGREVPTLSPECQLLYLAVHGAKHLWAKLTWVGDVARVIEKGLDWPRAIELSDEVRCVRPVLLGVLLAHDLLQARVPPRMVDQAEADSVILALAANVKSRLSQIAPSMPTSLELVAFNSKLAETTFAKVRHYAGLLKAPTEADAVVVRLPQSLLPLYYPIRLGRLTLKYCALLGRRSL